MLLCHPSLVLVSVTYMAVHWALQNYFSPSTPDRPPPPPYTHTPPSTTLSCSLCVSLSPFLSLSPSLSLGLSLSIPHPPTLSLSPVSCPIFLLRPVPPRPPPPFLSNSRWLTTAKGTGISTDGGSILETGRASLGNTDVGRTVRVCTRLHHCGGFPQTHSLLRHTKDYK